MNADGQSKVVFDDPTEMIGRPDDRLLEYYNTQLMYFKDTAKGAGWPNETDRRTRFEIMLGAIGVGDARPLTLCDLGCGTAELLSFIKERGINGVRYVGVDRSADALEFARKKHPEAEFHQIDVLDPRAVLGKLEADYVIANGLFTVKADLSQEEMRCFWTKVVDKMWSLARRGIAFNLMSTIVDWERSDLFHVSMDEAARLLHGLAGRNVVLRADYGLYEFTAYAYKQQLASSPSASTSKSPATLGSVPVLQPSMPTKRALSRYLDRIDASHVYSNHGPLSLELAARLSERFSLQPHTLVCASSGTTALTSAILVAAGRANRARPLALVPSFTFPATALAAEQCGYDVELADIDEETWMLDPRCVRDRSDLGAIGIVIPVAPFGRPVPQEPWLAFRAQTGIPVVIDAAACFEAYCSSRSERPGLLLEALSFHATKSYSTGEGGAVISQDPALVLAAAQSITFGFRGERVCSAPGLNGKMSEYHAAVGLAELDGWNEKAGAFARVAEIYREEFHRVDLARFLIGPPDIASCYMLFRASSVPIAARLRDALDAAGIGHRAWYSLGLHSQPHFRRPHHSAFPVTSSLAGRLIGLPAGIHLSREDIRRVADVVASHA